MPVRWFCLHGCTAGVRPIDGAYPKIGAVIFSGLHSHRCVSMPTDHLFGFLSRIAINGWLAGRNLDGTTVSSLFLSQAPVTSHLFFPYSYSLSLSLSLFLSLSVSNIFLIYDTFLSIVQWSTSNSNLNQPEFFLSRWHKILWDFERQTDTKSLSEDQISS